MFSCLEDFYKAKKVATTATRATTMLGEAIEPAPLEAPDPEGLAALEELELEPEVAAGAAAEDEEAPLLRASVMSWGIIMGAPLARLRLTDPSLLITSVLAAKKVRVYLLGSLVLAGNCNNVMTHMTFCATYCCDHDGIELISMPEPHEAACVLFSHCWLVYEAIAAISELCNRILVMELNSMSLNIR